MEKDRNVEVMRLNVRDAFLIISSLVVLIISSLNAYQGILS